MIITRNWVQEYIDISKITTDDICKTLNSIGLEVDSLQTQRVPSKVVVGKVLEKKKHPDADKLNICQVDIGGEKVQIVCGAKNVDAGQFVPVAVVGCDLGNNFKIKKAKLRGVESNGMICSSTEIGLPKLNDGILELDSSIGELVIGKELKNYPLMNDDVIEIELTANRGDCLSINGVARELSAYYNIPFIEQENSIEVNDLGIGQVLEVESSGDIDSKYIYKVAALEDFRLPVLCKLRVGILEKFEESDLKDTITYVTHSTGVILNAYARKDLKSKDKEEISVLSIKKDAQGFDSVEGKEQLSTICINHEKINEDEKSEYVIEATYMEPELLSKKVFETKKKTGEIYYRTSRGSEPCLEFGIDTFCSLISKAGGKLYNGTEAYNDYNEKHTLDVNIDKINSIIGQEVQKATIENILSSLGFEVKDVANNVLSLKVPLFRHDIKNIADVTEEIVRIIGIDNIKAKPQVIDEANRANKTSVNLRKRNKLRFKAIENGFYETVTYVLANKEKLERYSLPTVKESLDLLNPIVKELDTFRTTVSLNLVEACSNNMKLGFKSAAFFEIGKIFNANREEKSVISFIFSGQKEIESFSNSGKPEDIEFFAFAKKVLNTIGKFDLVPMKKIPNKLIHPYQNASVIIDNEEVGFISKLHPRVCDDYDLSNTFIAEIDFEKIKNDLTKVEAFSKFQSSKKDLSIVTPKSMEYKEIKEVIDSIKDKNIKQYNLIDIYSDEKLGENESLTIRFVLQNDDKTLEEEDITSTMNNILDTLNNKLGISLRD
ncbi:phenylalanine--tRNA ligase subunit beta [Halarcobacter anaerophilus]|uniref:Phenylalanine--tRNA ligase beta subunit n=1 Tax=Halarcobacter anaerophilus TaxID=877500 RepID=A0A4Q0XW14_9BACT|nr:phenylalanine--tRNA ligase subunit beta [Halarcobacter anaerophilus]QDF27941.1 phenylalanyl-tRNA synthetase, beta subunit [Halarcobacter anaerophilus]RXJ61777.1 phenylalanine--tRNA ligase subunit beta [Halarcobacter anaerophilus]